MLPGEHAGWAAHKARYWPNHHPIASAADVIAIEIATDIAISFAHSQYDTHAYSSRLHCRTASSVELAGDTSGHSAEHLKLIHHPVERRMRPVLDLDPAVGPPTAVHAVAMLGDQPLQPHQAGMAEQVRTNLDLFEWRRTRRASSLARSNPSQRRAPCAPSRCMIIIPRTASALASVTANAALHAALRATMRPRWPRGMCSRRRRRPSAVFRKASHYPRSSPVLR